MIVTLPPCESRQLEEIAKLTRLSPAEMLRGVVRLAHQEMSTARAVYWVQRIAVVLPPGTESLAARHHRGNQ